MLTVDFGEFAMNRTQVQLWYNRFTEGRENVNDDTKTISSSIKCEGFTYCFLHHEFLLQGSMANKEYYLEVMRRLREAIRQSLIYFAR